jgi:hypothetical protein
MRWKRQFPQRVTARLCGDHDVGALCPSDIPLTSSFEKGETEGIPCISPCYLASLPALRPATGEVWEGLRLIISSDGD